MVRNVKPFVERFPGLPKWLDGPYVRRMAQEWGCTEAAARKQLMQEDKDNE